MKHNFYVLMFLNKWGNDIIVFYKKIRNSLISEGRAIIIITENDYVKTRCPIAFMFFKSISSVLFCMSMLNFTYQRLMPFVIGCKSTRRRNAVLCKKLRN